MGQHQPSQDLDGASDSRPIADAFPADSSFWEQSPLGSPRSWPPSLKAFASFITTLPHPAGIYWSEDFVLLHNEAWGEVCSATSEQGKPQRKRLGDEALQALRSSMKGRTSHALPSWQLVEHGSQKHRALPVLLSPLMDPDTSSGGVVAQFFPRPEVFHTLFKKMSLGKSTDATKRRGEFKNNIRTLDDIPLDEHPFFRRFAEMLPTGLAILNYKAEAVFVNQHFYDLTTHRGQDRSFKSWPNTIHPEDYEEVMHAYHEAFDKGTEMRVEFRAQGQNNPWRLLLLTPLGDDNLRHISLREYGGFICAVIDITSNKNAEFAQRKAAQEAQERKEQQERFIDMISHEIRNPLSAVLHCSEEISDAVQNDDDSPRKREIIEAAETIALCVAHQKNIVDDVLSFSKLDASMLSLTPKTSYPKRQLADALKMFQPELRKQHMDMKYSVDVSYEELNVKWVKADLTRISQVLVNLVSNAIKFTAKKSGEKTLSIAVGASLERPTSYPPSVVFFDTDDLGYRMNATLTSEWGNGETVYIMVAVKDTGIGISAEGQTRLFERFRQATPKTEEIYGGSGLGLNISRKLCQLHGGEIGVASKEGMGSTFGFFFKCRRTEAPSSPQETDLKMAEVERHSDELRRRIIDLGHESSEDIKDEDLPPSLHSPPTEKVKEAHPETQTATDQWQHTAKIANNVEQRQSPDMYTSFHRRSVSEDTRVANEGKKGVPDKDTGAQASGKQEPEAMTVPTKRERKGSDASPSVLLVEDNVINQRILSRKLKAKGFDVTIANNGREAVDTVKGHSEPPREGDNDAATAAPPLPFDCVLMDQEMPVMDGNAASKAIRDLEREGRVMKGHVPILGVTANVRKEQMEDMMLAGMDDVIHKPYKIEDMVDKIHNLVGRRGSAGGAVGEAMPNREGEEKS